MNVHYQSLLISYDKVPLVYELKYLLLHMLNNMLKFEWQFMRHRVIDERKESLILGSTVYSN